ncbi:rubredoxin [Desulfovibrio sulfodismutans]|uniref:Rubredoxin n=1 Tax=Desulfolutivibrio sulfodismutans TaxID=63561 RepID=A0A7K3NKS7_9BACT|nr:rubredoxin [Desulfolutivibrio sulfodismutans]NDY56806.1 rubredoxin [Desulfolutivibrio sulfodismutans]QLA10945.1 rubredoxin [Desulfolutivibrio sulfodismutans DSM 3696]
MMRYMCLLCGYTYDPKRGDPKGGLEPGTDLATAPQEWVCPRCGAGQDAFAMRDDDDEE